MRDETPRLIAICALSGALLLGIGIGVAEAHVSQLEREALAAFEAEAGPILLAPDPHAAAQVRAAAATPYFVEVTVTTEEFNAAREAYMQARANATL
jgi:hypothetical protein